MRLLTVVTLSLCLWQLTQAQTNGRVQPKPESPPKTDDLTSAREATDTFLNGVKISELPEGRQLLSETQWITGQADNGENFYLRPRFTEATPLFERLFDTDVPGVQGYKRLLDMKAVSEAGTPLLIRYFMVAFKDRHTNKWKVLDTGTDEDADVDHQVAYFREKLHETTFTSEEDNYLSYGHWLLLAGRTKEAREALTTALSASPNITGIYVHTDKYAPLYRLQIQALLTAIDGIAAN
jgi:hypothetical protein